MFAKVTTLILGVITVIAVAAVAVVVIIVTAITPVSRTSGQAPRPAGPVESAGGPTAGGPTAGGPTAGGPSLIWEGRLPAGENGQTQCVRLELDAGSQVRVGECGTALSAKAFPGRRDLEWSEIQSRFAPFEYQTKTDHLLFRGTGSLEGPAWQRALAAWATMTYGEASSGRVSAATGAGMSWMLGPLPTSPDRCAHLSVTGYGYAFADSVPCQGGGVSQDSQSGWLQPAEMTQFDAWLYGLAVYDQAMTHFQGAGTKEPLGTDVEAMDRWARLVFARLRPGDELQPAAPPAATDQPANPPGWQTFTSVRYQYTVDYPSGWVISTEGLVPTGRTNGTDGDMERVTFKLPDAGALNQVASIMIEASRGGAGTFDGCMQAVAVAGAKACRNSKPAGQNPAQEVVFFSRRDASFVVQLVYDDPRFVKLFDQVVASFKFTDAARFTTPTPTPADAGAVSTQGMRGILIARADNAVDLIGPNGGVITVGRLDGPVDLPSLQTASNVLAQDGAVYLVLP